MATSMKPKILCLTLVSPDLPEIVLMRNTEERNKLIAFSQTWFDLEWVLIDKTEPHLPNDVGATSQVARLRNNAIDEYLKDDHDMVFWLDSDLVEFPQTLLERLQRRQIDIESQLLSRELLPTRAKIVSPLVLVELTDKFYDWGAFIQRGTSHIRPYQFNQIYGRNLESDPPYFHPGYELKPLMEMDSVAQCVLIPAEIYRQGARHLAKNVFFEFHSVCEAARKMGVKTFVDRTVTAFHADRTLYGKNWGTPR